MTDRSRKFLKENKQAFPLFGVRVNEVTICECGNKLTDKEVFYDTCLQCGESIPEQTEPLIKDTKMKNTENKIVKNGKLPIHSVLGSLFYQKVEKLVNEWKKTELGTELGETTPFSPEAEIEAGFGCFLEWLKKRDE